MRKPDKLKQKFQSSFYELPTRSFCL